MTIRRWWDDNPDERYWLEVTDREDLGANLHAPQVDDGGKEHWSYALVAEVAAGDVVFHWWKVPGTEPALVGYSYAVGDVKEETILWEAHGTSARAAGAEVRPEPSWMMPLTEFTQFDSPITLERLRTLEGGLRQAQQATLSAHGGKAPYFPFAFSTKRPVRPAQGYLMKFPVALIAAIPELAALFGGSGLAKPSPAGSRTPRTRPRGRNGRQQEPLVRKAVERHAVDWTVQYLEGLGYDVADVGDFGPYDVLALREDGELHVEVKGSSTEPVAVELTDGEVKHAEEGCERVLVVVDAIRVDRSGGKIKTTGGRPRIWWDWEADDNALVATRYRYTLPGAAERPR